jgi:hypothetical protein
MIEAAKTTAIHLFIYPSWQSIYAGGIYCDFFQRVAHSVVTKLFAVSPSVIDDEGDGIERLLRTTLNLL